MIGIFGYIPVPIANIEVSSIPYNSDMFVLNYAFRVRGTTQYINYDFNSMVKFGNKYLGASPDGIYELGGDTDNGDKIAAYFKPVVTDFGISNSKKVRFALIGYEASGDLIMTVEGGKSGASQIVKTFGDGPQWRKVSGNRTVRGRYLTFIISNVDGCDFGINSINVALVVMSKK